MGYAPGGRCELASGALCIRGTILALYDLLVKRCTIAAVTADQLREAQAAFEQAQAAAEEARGERNRVLREALATGWTQEEISATTGLTQGRVSQIIRRG